MRNSIIRTVKFTLGILVLMATLGNSGCLVKTGSDLDKLKKLDQASLRIYKAGDRLKYNVLVNGLVKGTLTIAYDTPLPGENLDSDPLTSGSTPIPGLLKETTTLDYGSNGPITIVRYITQQTQSATEYGSVTLYAYNSQSSTTEHNYVSTNNVLDTNNLLEPAIVFSSPFLDQSTFQPVATTDQTIDYFVFPCTELTNQCVSYNQELYETNEFSKMQVYDLSNSVDFFETVQLPYTGKMLGLSSGSADSRKTLLNIRSFCGAPNDTTINYSGTEFLYPSIGVVRFEMNCTSTEFSFLTADLSSVNFSY